MRIIRSAELPHHPLTGKKFGTEAANYSIGRKPYPMEIIDFIKSYVKPDANLLDIGCGNGRATVMLRDCITTKVTGFDVDPDMIEEAKNNTKRRGFEIPYSQGDVRDLANHFAPKSFIAITACTAFHWFSKPEHISAIHSVLDPNGHFFVVTGGGDELRAECRKIVSDIIGRSVSHVKDQGVVAALEGNRFTVIDSKKILVDEQFTYDELVAKTKSHDLWTELSDAEKEKVWPKLEEHLKTKLQNGSATLNMKYMCLVAKPVQFLG